MPVGIGRIPLKIKIIAFGAVMISMFIAGYFYGEKRYADCKADFAKERADALAKAQKQIEEVRNEYKGIREGIPAGEDHPAPAVDYVLDRLRERDSRR